MTQKFIFIVLATICVLIGLLGLVIPIIPGILFLIVAAGLFAQLIPAVRQRLSRNPRMQRLFTRLDAGEQLAVFEQIKLVFLAAAEVITRPIRK